MSSPAQPQPSKKLLWTGRVLSALVVLFLISDAVFHLVKPSPVMQAFAELGFPLRLAMALGIVELICVALYAFPRTSILGAILLTGYLGGAVATQVRVGNPFFGEALFPVYVAVLMWGGLFLREARVRALMPWTSRD